MRVAIDFGLTNLDIVVEGEDNRLQRCTVPAAGAVDVAQLERAIRATGFLPTDFEQIVVTGGQHRRLPQRYGPTPVAGVNEVTAIGRGGLHLAGLPEALVVSAGSGTAMVAARDGDIHHATGSAVGGGTLQGLGKLLLGTADAGEIDELAAAGNSNAVDLTLLEATGGVLGHLPADANAVNFGRIPRMSNSDPGWMPGRADIAAGLVVMVGQVIAVIAVNAARAEGLEQIVVVGHLVDLPTVRRVLETVAGYYDAHIVVPEMPGYATAMGALMSVHS
ncbi:MAG: Fumble domain-containing protein [Chloroflexi bacterium]|nr:Fumble domain-containing protein [Chloroflexota bacterium]MCL5275826.1 Fumble domain-containing protein [Chloroflexota bacterium]